MEYRLQVYGLEEENWNKAALSVVVVGASGDLARKKIYPALFALYVEGMLPEYFTIYGYARSKMSNEEFREYIGMNLTCRQVALCMPAAVLDSVSATATCK